MVRRREDAPLAVEVPPAGADRPSWGKVGIITAIGFIVGVVWPRVAGVRLGPSVPEAPSAIGAASAAASGAVVEPLVARAPASVLPPAVAVAPAPSLPPAPAVSSAPTVETSSGGATAQVTWEVALIRDAPKTGKILARLQRGTSLRIGAAKDGWYPVKYGDGFGSDGWVYRGAIGK